MSIEIKLIPVTEFQQNCRVLFDAGNRQAVVFDPGGEAEKVIEFISRQQLKIEAVYLTHSHIDHCGGVAALLRSCPAPLYGHRAEKSFRQNVVTAAQMYGFAGPAYENCPEPDIFLDEQSQIVILGQKVRVLQTPGHSPGSVSFWFPEQRWLISGDVLFRGSIGRTDLPGGDYQILIDSIGRLITELPADARVLPGHGPDTSLEEEKVSNPFLTGESPL